jgi:hypothetical protein
MILDAIVYWVGVNHDANLSCCSQLELMEETTAIPQFLLRELQTLYTWCELRLKLREVRRGKNFSCLRQ